MADAIAGMIWTVITILVFTSSWRVACAMEPNGVIFQRLLHSALITWAVLVGSTIILGAIGLLFATALVGVVTAVSLCLLWLVSAVDLKITRLIMRDNPYPNELLKHQHTVSTEENCEWVYFVGWSVVGTAWVARVLLYGLLEYPSDWDTMNYHIPIIHAWLRANNLYAPDCQEWFVPGTNEVIGLWLVGIFSGDYLIGLINLMSVLVLVLAIIDLCRQVGLPIHYQHLTGLIGISMGVIFRQSLTAKNDIAADALFISTLAYAMRHASNGRRFDCLMTATCLGLLAGVKYYAVGYAAVAGVTWVLGVAMSFGWRKSAQVAIIAVLGLLAFSGYWYGRNALVTGTPFYPKGYSPQTDALSNWRPDGTWGTTLLGNRSPDVIPMLMEAVLKYGGPASYVAVLILPVTLTWLICGRSWLTRCSVPHDQQVAPRCLAAAICGACLVWGVIPFAVELEPGSLNSLRDGYLTVRFGICFLTLTIIALVVLIVDFLHMLQSRYSRIIALALGVGIVVWHMCYSIPHFIHGVDIVDYALTVAVIASLAFLVTQGLLYPCVKLRFLTLTIAACAVSIVCVLLAQEWHANFINYFSLSMHKSRVLNPIEHLQSPPAKVYVVGYRIYPFSGSKRKMSVCRNLRLTVECQFLFYLYERDVSHIIIAQVGPDWVGHIARIRDWTERRPDVFRVIFTDDVYIVFEIDRLALLTLL